MEERCFHCGGILLEKSEPVGITYRGASCCDLGLYSVCTKCGTEQATPRQTKANKDQTLKFRAMVDNWFKEVEQDW